MRFLILTQKVDQADPILGFFHRWIEEFAKHCQSVIVICLQKGEFSLPDNVRVRSLGKETGSSRLKYLVNFYRFIWRERDNYEAVFVHMNQEYVLLGGPIWKLLGKKIFLWRNHHAGNLLTDAAAAFCHKIFCTSRYSFTTKYRKTVLMPVGIDTDLFRPLPNIERTKNSILFLSRMAPVKKPDLLLRALSVLNQKKIDFITNFYGDPLPADQDYYQALKNLVGAKGLSPKVAFHPGLSNRQTPAIYSAHQIFINLSSSGMYDKTIFEAMACGCQVLVSNENLRSEIPESYLVGPDNVEELSEKLTNLLVEQATDRFGFRQYVEEKHSLRLLAKRLNQELR